MRPRGGYKTITVLQLCGVLAAYDAGEIGIRDVRVFFASAAAVAIREAAIRSGRARKEQGKELARYRLRELSRLTLLDEADVARAARRLARAGLVRIAEDAIELAREPNSKAVELAGAVCGGSRSPRRPVPMPRPILRLLAKSERIAFIKTLLAYLIRGLTLHRGSGEVSGAGSVKLTWIADQFGLSERAARYARRELIKLGVLADDPGSSQRKLNRHGSYFTVNLDWADAPASRMTEAILAPLPAKKSPRFAPPLRDKGTSFGTENQGTRRGEPSGLRGASEWERGTKECRPSLRNIRPDDLRRTKRVLELYEQASRAGWLVPSEANRTNVVAAAARATRAQGDPARIFVAIVRRGLWHHITGEEEARAVAALKRIDDPGQPQRDRRRDQDPSGTKEPSIAEMIQSLCDRLVA